MACVYCRQPMDHPDHAIFCLPYANSRPKGKIVRVAKVILDIAIILGLSFVVVVYMFGLT